MESHAPALARPSATEVDAMVTANLALVGHLVRETLGRVPAHVSRDELTSAGLFALVVSAQNFDDSRGVPFARFAAIRIRGALMDELRGLDWASRSVRGRARQADTVRAQLASTLGRSPKPEEVAQAMGVTVAEVDSIDHDVQRASVLSLQGFAPNSGPELLSDAAVGPEALLVQREQIGYLHDAIAELPERLRTVVEDYFFSERKMSDIAAELGVTESRVSQMRAEALKILRDGMSTAMEPADDELATARKTNARAEGSARQAAQRAAYATAVATRSTLSARLAMTNALGEVQGAPFGLAQSG
ncbi:RNA polymerase sigma-28 (SigD/FliA/WhiG) subunit [Jatrophihabitans sp. GAS493]|uniref:sigma-70 family RNA polymerase sigma factor n=1 Tax=Jatrophihabitans sp. GAS493 TaxID=1907575 RepID=UPI000BC08C59|nr:sigma-70 family RNA polymerase sigma factor [Jatrophihabitans sp. GAS493]SOD71348.1 RNA polymerase sigma-28 (SigD/FliA/WhiG) subunit [Jatrophihabitans sp. GAS493]